VRGASLLALRLGLSLLAVHRQVIRQEAPIMIGGAVLLIVPGLDGSLGLFDGSLLLGLLMACTVFLVRQSRAEPQASGRPIVNRAAAAASMVSTQETGDANDDASLLHEAADEGCIAGVNVVADVPTCFQRRTPVAASASSTARTKRRF